jgi:hypothetical protein
MTSATNLQLFTNVLIYANGALLAMADNISVSHQTNAQDVNTIALAFAGQTAGAPKCMVSCDSAVPFAGMEFDPTQYMASMTPLTLTAFAAGSQVNLKGFITESDLGYGVNSSSKLSFKATCSFSTWETL